MVINNVVQNHPSKAMVNRFHVVIVSEKILDIMKKFPNPSVCEKIADEKNRKEILVSSDLRDLRENLKILNPPAPGYKMRVVHKSGTCPECHNNGKIFCPHLGESIRTNVNVYEVK